MCATGRRIGKSVKTHKGKHARKSFPGRDIQTDKMVQKTPGHNFNFRPQFFSALMHCLLLNIKATSCRCVQIKLTTNPIISSSIKSNLSK